MIRILYPSLVQPPLPDTVIESRWHQPWSEPPKRYFLNTASQLAFFWSESQQFPETVTESRWHLPWSEPVRLKPGLHHSLQQFQPYNETQQFPETVTESRWHQPWSEPVRVKPGLTTATNADNHFLELNPQPIIQVPSWFNALSDPVRIRWFATALQQFQPYEETQQFPESTSEDKWHQPWSEPLVKAKQWLLAAQQEFIEFDTFPFVKIDWFNPLTEPVSTKWFAAAQQQTQGYDETQQFPESVTEDRWHQPWSEPVRVKSNIGEGRQQSLASPASGPIVPFSWFIALNEPTRRASLAQLTAPDAFVAQQAATPAPNIDWTNFLSVPIQYSTKWTTGDTSSLFPSVQNITEDMWHQGWVNPVSVRSLFVQVQQVSTGPFVTTAPTVPSVDGWGSQLSDPVRVKQAVAWQQFIAQAEAAPFTESVSEDKWHQPWSDPVRVKPGLYTQLQTVLAFVATVPFPFPDSWGFAYTDPVRQKLGLPVTQQQFLAQSESQQFPESVTEDRWHQPWSDPPKPKSALQIALQQGYFFDPTTITPAAPPVDGWVSQLSEPVVKSKPSVVWQQFLAQDINPADITTFISMAWYLQLAEPVRQAQRLGVGLNPDQAEVINPSLITPFVGMGWYLPLSDNGRRTPQYSAMLPIDANLNPNPIPNPPTFGVFAVSGGDVNDRFPVNGVSYTYSPLSHRTN